jgi:hypothetical protein
MSGCYKRYPRRVVDIQTGFQALALAGNKTLYIVTYLSGHFNGGQDMVDYETISAKKIPFGKNNFIEIARKKAVSSNGETEFISISRGYFTTDAEGKDAPRYKNSVTIPLDEDVRDQIAKVMLEI